MDPWTSSAHVRIGAEGPVENSIAALQGQMTDLVRRVRGVARRSNRFSWLSWGFLYALYFGLVFGVLIGVAYPTFGAALGDGLLSLCFLPALALLALSLRELFFGRREGLEPGLPPNATWVGIPVEPAPGWTEMVQQSQQLITRAKNEVDFSFLPLCLGALGFGAFLGFGLLRLVAPSIGGWLGILDLVVPIPFVLLVWPLYRTGRRWIGGYQSFLDRQVREFSRLESEFFWQFAGIAAPR